MKKKTAHKGTIKDITSDSQVNSHFPYRWSPASLTLNIYFYLFSILNLTKIRKHNQTHILKPPKNQNRRAVKDIASVSQVNSHFQYRWSPAILTLNIYFYLFSLLNLTKIRKHNQTHILKPPKNQNRRAALGRSKFQKQIIFYTLDKIKYGLFYTQGKLTWKA